MARIPKVVSESKLSSLQGSINQNVNWMNGAYVWPSYLLLLAGFRILTFYLLSEVLESASQWTLLFVAHGLITFWALHWARGSPVWEDQGAHIDHTVWEQIDNGVPWTDTRKFCMIVPIVLFVLCSHYTDYDKIHLSINAAILAVLLIAKLPEMHGVRIFRINKATVDNSDTE